MTDATVLPRVRAARRWLEQRVVGQDRLMQRLVVALVCGGHLLVEGAPGLAKTRAIKELARVVEGDFHRIQFTPDLLPGDITGSEIYRNETGSFEFQPGPVFHNMVLADEVNRAPAKVQSALLEAMAEHQVTVGRRTLALPPLFLVMATQNPIEHEGAYPLPEAQLDRFLMLVRVDYPPPAVEHEILRLAREEHAGLAGEEPEGRLSQEDVFRARREASEVFMAPAVERYIVELVAATRRRPDLDYGASPRATIAIDQCARITAWLEARDYTSPEDVQSVAHDVMRHRLIPTFEAQARGIEMDALIDDLLGDVPVP